MRLKTLGLALILMSLMTGRAAAAEIVRTGTGCLKLSTGTLSKIKVGGQPLAPCTAGEVIARLSSGDITEVATPATGGLEGGSNNGALSVSLQTGFRLPQACTPGQVPAWTGAFWECVTPPAPGGGGGLARLEELRGLPCGTGSDTGTVSLVINPLSHAVGLACPPAGQFQLDVAVGGPGSVRSATPEIACGSGQADCSHSFDSGEIVTLTASSPADVSGFGGWGGACSGADPTCQVTMDRARQVIAEFLPTLTLHLVTVASARNTNCAFNICVTVDTFTQSLARVTVLDLDTAQVAGVCNADTTLVVAVTGFGAPSFNTTTCNIPVRPGHRLRLTADDAVVLGGTQSFFTWSAGGCDGSTDPTCEPADAVTDHDEMTAAFH